MTWTVDEVDVKDTQTFNAYAAWEGVVRPSVAQGLGGEALFQPVYAQVNLDAGPTAVDDILQALGAAFLIPDESAVILARIQQALHDQKDLPEVSLRFFFYQPEMPNQSAVLHENTDKKPLYHILRVGTAVPRSQLSNPDSGNAPPGGEMNEVDTSIVVTAVIDDAMGVAHERFRKQGGQSTRILRFWKQELEGFNARPNGPGVLLGQEFSADDLKRFLEASKGHEAEFYSKLYVDAGNSSGLSAAFASLSRAASIYAQAEALAARGDKDSVEFQGLLNDLLTQTTKAAFKRRQPVIQFLSVGDPLADTNPLAPFAQEITIQRAALNLLDRRYRRPFGEAATHGTAVMDLAAGAEPGTADDQPIFAVELPALATIETSGARLESYVLQAVQRILSWADAYEKDDGTKVRVPVVINLSYGIASGPKDGTGFLEAELARLIEARNAQVATALVMPAGNDYRAQLSAVATVPEEEEETFEWRVLADDHTPSFAELRLDRANGWEIEFHTPAVGTVPVTPVVPGKARRYQTGDVASVYVQGEPGRPDGALVTCALAPTYSVEPPYATCTPGAYRVVVRNTDPDKPLVVRFGVQRDDTPVGFGSFGRQSYADGPVSTQTDPITKTYEVPDSGLSAVSRETTLSALATANSPAVLAVGAAFWDDHRMGVSAPSARQPAYYTSSGAGLTRQPDVSAVAETGRALSGIMAAGPWSGSTRMLSGTSAAAPVVTRQIATYLRKEHASGRQSPFDKTAFLAWLPGAGTGQTDPRLGSGTTTNVEPIHGRKVKRRVR